jgi:Holliday junction DNA helicase RuvB
MALIFFAVMVAVFGGWAVNADRRQRQQRRSHIAAGRSLYLMDMSLTPDMLMASWGTLADHRGTQLERELRLAEETHLRDEVRSLRAQVAVQAAAQAPATTALPTADERYPIVFKPDEPESFDSYLGQVHIIKPLRAAVQALEPHARVIAHCLFTGLPGRGKTLLAKVVGRELQRRARALGLRPLPYLETFASNLNSVEDLDAVVRELQAAGGGVWFIDELHVLDHELSTKIFALMEDAKYPFHGSTVPTPVPSVMVIGATTDYGRLHPALKRRFGEAYMVRPMSRTELLTLVKQRTFPISDAAATLLVDRTHWSGAPYEALTLRAQAEVFSRARGASAIGVDDVREVFDTFEIDDQGLRWMDREVLRTLFKFPRFRKGGAEFVCYAASERDLCGTAGLDPEEYREAIKPRLLARGLLETRAGYGQALSPNAIDRYESLKAS